MLLGLTEELLKYIGRTVS